MADVVGAEDAKLEVAAMNSLTVNLHMLMAAFYRPSAGRGAILIEAGAFPSDRIAVVTQVAPTPARTPTPALARTRTLALTLTRTRTAAAQPQPRPRDRAHRGDPACRRAAAHGGYPRGH